MSIEDMINKIEVWELEAFGEKYYYIAKEGESKEDFLKRVFKWGEPFLPKVSEMRYFTEEENKEYAKGLAAIGYETGYNIMDAYKVKPIVPPTTDSIVYNPRGVDDGIKCPKCGSRARIQGISRTTLAYYPPIYDENGVNTNPDRNTTTTTWECRNCGENYATKG